MKILKKRFRQQRADAKFRGIRFDLTFSDWLQIWSESGHLHERGSGKGRYVMARLGDRGPYRVDNVKIITHEQNSSERRLSVASKEAIRRANLGKVVSAETRIKLSEIGTGKVQSLETRNKRSRSMMGKRNGLGYRWTPEQRARLSTARLGNTNWRGRSIGVSS